MVPSISFCSASGSIGGGICHLFSIARTAIIQDKDFRHISTTLVYVSGKFIGRVDDPEKTRNTWRLARAEKRLRGFSHCDFMIMFQPTMAPIMSTMATMIVKYWNNDFSLAKSSAKNETTIATTPRIPPM